MWYTTKYDGTHQKHRHFDRLRTRVDSTRDYYDTSLHSLFLDVSKGFWGRLNQAFVGIFVVLLLFPSISHAALGDNLVSCWKFDESSGNPADAKGSNTLTNVNTTTFNTGVLSNAAYFASASTQYFTITDAAQTGLDLSGDFTLAGWFYLADHTIDSALITKTNGGAQQAYYMYTNNSGKIFVDISQDGTQTSNKYHRQQTDTVAISQNTTWYFIAATFVLGTNTTVIYVNGAATSSSVGFGTGITTGIFNASSPFRVSGDGVDPGWKLNGRVDNVGVWSRALSSGEILQIYNSGVGLACNFVVAAAASPAIQSTIMWW